MPSRWMLLVLLMWMAVGVLVDVVVALKRKGMQTCEVVEAGFGAWDDAGRELRWRVDHAVYGVDVGSSLGGVQ